jgi:hypothetical protein
MDSQVQPHDPPTLGEATLSAPTHSSAPAEDTLVSGVKQGISFDLVALVCFAAFLGLMFSIMNTIGIVGVLIILAVVICIAVGSIVALRRS